MCKTECGGVCRTGRHGIHEALRMLREKSTVLLQMLVSVSKAVLFTLLAEKSDGVTAHREKRVYFEQEVKFRA